MRLPNHLPRTVAELCSHPEVQRIIMLTFGSAYSPRLLDCEDQTRIEPEQVWQTFIEALERGYFHLDDKLWERKNYSPVRNSENISQL
jgi:hypothetical protein